MKLAIAALWAMLIMLAASQSLGDLPECAQTCVGSEMITGGCQLIDIKCICQATFFINSLSCCLVNNCDASDQEATFKFAVNLCASVKVTLPSSVSCSTAGQNSTSVAKTTTSSGTSSSIGSNMMSSMRGGMSGNMNSTGTTSPTTSFVSPIVSSDTNTATPTAVQSSSTSNTHTTTTTAASSSLYSAAAGYAGLEPGMGMAGLAVAVLAIL